MAFTLKQKRDAYKRLPPELRDFVMSNEIAELITSSLKELGLNDEEVDLADSEILYAMYCLQSLDEAMNNVALICGKKVNELTTLRSSLQDNVFNNYKINIEDFIKLNKIPELTQNIDGVVHPNNASPDQLSLTSAAAIVPKITLPTENLALTRQVEIHPVIEEGEVVHAVPHVETPVKNEHEEISIIQPPIEEKKEDPKPTIPHYPGGIDPYREPLV